jgi:hypothetical protein
MIFEGYDENLPAFMEVKSKPKTEKEVLMSKMQILTKDEMEGFLQMDYKSMRAVVDKFTMQKKTLYAKLNEISNEREPDIRKEQTIFASIMRINDYLADIDTVFPSSLKKSL